MKLPEEITSLNQWVVNKKDSKLPFNARTMQPASVSDTYSWSTYQNAIKAVESGNADYLGFVFYDNGIVGIDIDKGFQNNGVLPTTETMDIINHLHSYTEKSKSGRGFHILVKGQLPFNGKNNRNGIEIYKTGRYFITTGKQMLYENIIENQEGIDYVVNKYFQDMPAEGKTNTNRYYSVEWSYNPKNISLEPVFPPIPEGCRNQSLTSLAGQYHSQDMTFDEIYDLLLIANEKACSPPLSEREIRSIVRSVSRYRRK